MAGPMVGPLLERLGLELDRDLLDARRQLPRSRAQPPARGRTAGRSSSASARAAPTSGIAWDGDADRCFFIDETGSSSTATSSPPLLAEALLAKHPGEAILYDVRASRAVPDTVRARRRHAPHQPRRARLLQGAHAQGGLAVRRRGLGPLLLPRLLLRGLRDAAGAARSSSTSPGSEQPFSELLRPYREHYFISGEINSEVSDQEGKMRELAERYADARQSLARRHLGRLRGLALQRAPLEHGAAAATVPGVAALARGHGAPPRRGARADPLVSDAASRRARRGRRAARRGGDARRRGASTRSRSPRRSRWGG